jgi:formylmethanofuran dehydrogenase subunit E
MTKQFDSKTVSCDSCGEEIEGDQAKAALGNTLCEECYPEIALDKCDVCGTPLKEEDAVRDELNNLLCDDCYQKFQEEKSN